MNKKAFQIANVTEADYRNWCKDNKKVINAAESRREFFARIQDGRLVKDLNGKIIKKRRKTEII